MSINALYPTRNECLQLCTTDNLQNNLCKLSKAFSDIDSRGPNCPEPSLTQRQMICGTNAIVAASKGNWDIAMHELSDAFENYEGKKLQPTDRNLTVPDRKLTINERVFFSAVITSLTCFLNM